MKRPETWLLSVGLLTFSGSAFTQALPVSRVVPCDATLNAPSQLTVQDDATHRGALLEAPSMITLPNGNKAVQFTVRHAKYPEPAPGILKVRYTVHWTDSCGRAVVVGNDMVEGFALDPQRHRTVIANALHPKATHAALRVYVID